MLVPWYLKVCRSNRMWSRKTNDKMGHIVRVVIASCIYKSYVTLRPKYIVGINSGL